MTTSHVKAIQQQQQRISIFFIFKGEDKVNVNVIVYTKVSGLLKVNTREDLREDDFFAGPCHKTLNTIAPPYRIYMEYS